MTKKTLTKKQKDILWKGVVNYIFEKRQREEMIYGISYGFTIKRHNYKTSPLPKNE